MSNEYPDMRPCSSMLARKSTPRPGPERKSTSTSTAKSAVVVTSASAQRSSARRITSAPFACTSTRGSALPSTQSDPALTNVSGSGSNSNVASVSSSVGWSSTTSGAGSAGGPSARQLIGGSSSISTSSTSTCSTSTSTCSTSTSTCSMWSMSTWCSISSATSSASISTCSISTSSTSTSTTVASRSSTSSGVSVSAQTGSHTGAGSASHACAGSASHAGTAGSIAAGWGRAVSGVPQSTKKPVLTASGSGWCSHGPSSDSSRGHSSATHGSTSAQASTGSSGSAMVHVGASQVGAQCVSVPESRISGSVASAESSAACSAVSSSGSTVSTDATSGSVGAQSSVPSQNAGGAPTSPAGGSGGCQPPVSHVVSGSGVTRCSSGASPRSQRSEPWRIATSIGGASAATSNAGDSELSASEPASTSSTAPSGGPPSGAPLVVAMNDEAVTKGSSAKVPVGGASRSGNGAPGSPSGSGSGRRASSSNTSTLCPVIASRGASKNAAGPVSVADANAGSSNVGSSNVGSSNVGSSNVGSSNVGSSNVGSSNVGSANPGSASAGVDGRAGGTTGAGARAAAIPFRFPRPPGGATIMARSRSASSGEMCSTSWSFRSTVAGVAPSATEMASSSRSLTGIRFPGGSARSLWSVPRYGVTPGAAWLRRSCATVSPMVVAGSPATTSSREVVLGPSSATSTPHDPASTHRSLSGIGTLPRSYATSSRRLRPAPRATSDSESPLLRRTDRRCFPSSFGVTVSSVVDASAMPVHIGGLRARL